MKRKKGVSIASDGDTRVRAEELDTPVYMHLMPNIKEILDGFNAIHGERPLRVELSPFLYKIFRESLLDTQVCAGEPGYDEVRNLLFHGVPVLSGDFDGVCLCR